MALVGPEEEVPVLPLQPVETRSEPPAEVGVVLDAVDDVEDERRRWWASEARPMAAEADESMLLSL